MAEVNVFLWIPLPIFVVAFAFCIVGLTTHEWIVTDDFEQGVYKQCVDGSCASIDSAPGLVVAARTILIDVVIVISYTTTMLILYIIMVRKDKVDRYARCCSYRFPTSILSSTILACVLTLIACILMIVEAYDKNNYSGTKLGYSFALPLVAGIALPVAGGLTFHGRIQRPAQVAPEADGNNDEDEPTKIVIGEEQP